ncbi:MAG: hypothetical protein QG654_467 [Patescibacteria group bacterium]|nr:hypothetical protein [Patescibacteria group bacterium]
MIEPLKHIKMKKLTAFTFIFFLPTISFGQECSFPIQHIDKLCTEGKRKSFVVPGQGILHHITCPVGGGDDLFVLTDTYESTRGCLLNGKYKLAKRHMKVESVGTKFFIVKVSDSKMKYKYDFELQSWTKLTKKDPRWSTGNREDP